jgi:pimeloyl-ACP methyl ester carboxylesterase
MSPLTVDGEIGDLTALVSEAAEGCCVLAGHSWGGLLVQLAAFRHPDLVAGLVLVDPADEEILAGIPWVMRAAMAAPGNVALLAYRLGLLGRVVRGAFGPFARRLTADPHLQSLILDAYASCYTNRTQVRMLRDENRLSSAAIPVIRQIRPASALPDVPVVVLSATKGLPKGIRGRWTKRQAGLTATAAGGEHIIAAGTGHAIHQERPEQVTTAILRVIDHVHQR